MPTSPRPKKKSPTMAPITDSPADMRSPAKIAGRAPGNMSLRSRVRRLAWCSVNRSCIALSAESSPNRVFTMMGKSEMMMHTTTRDVWPYPHQNPINGTMARMGIACSVTMKGNTARSTILAWLIIVARNKPIEIAMTSPMSATLALDQSPVSISVKLAESRNPTSTTSCSGRIRNRRLSSMTTKER